MGSILYDKIMNQSLLIIKILLININLIDVMHFCYKIFG